MVCGVLLLATMLNYMDRQTLAVTSPMLKMSFNLHEGRLGYLEGGFGIAFAVGSLLFGVLADRWGPRYLYPAVLAGWSFAGVATAFAENEFLQNSLQSTGDPPGTGFFRWVLGCRIVLGFCEAGHWPCALLTVRAIMSTQNRTLGNGILQSGASIGAILVPLYIQVAEWFGQTWEFPFWSIGVVGLLWVPAWFALVGRRNISQLPAVDVVSPIEQEEARTEPAHYFFQRLIVLFITVASLTISWQFLRAWFVLFLQDHHHYPPTMARLLLSGFFGIADVGCILSGVLVSALMANGWKLHSSRVVGYFLFSLLSACAALVPFVGNGWLMIAMLFIAGAGILGLHPFYYALAQEISKSRMGTYTGALAASGWIVSSLSQMYLGKQILATESYQLGWTIVGLAPLAGLVAIALLWPRSEEISVSQLQEK